MTSATPASSALGRPFLELYGISACSGMAMSAFALSSSAWMEQVGVAQFWIGLVGAGYYAAQIAGAPLAERWTRRHGARAAMAAGLALAGLASPLFAFVTEPWLLGLVRALAGLGVGMCVTAGQTLLVAASGPQQRGMVTGLHALAFAVGLALGPVWSTPLYQLSVRWAALGGASVFLIALSASVALPRGARGLAVQRQPVAAKIWLPLQGIFAYGFAESALFALYPAVLVQAGMSVRRIGVIFLCFVLGSVAATLPLTRAGDRWGRERTLAACVLVSVVGVLCLVWAPSYPLQVLCALIAGGAVGSSYALDVALVGDALSAEELPSGMALFTVALGVGCVLGPLVTGAALSAFGAGSIFVPTALVFSLLLVRLSTTASLRGPLPRLGGERA